MAASNAKGPGLLYVNSQITSSKMSPEVFTKWYQGEHIPDILRTSGMNAAYRYYNISKGKVSNSKPYLALYPLENASFLDTEEFKSIPVHSDLLPSESRCVFDVADFDTRYYTTLGKEEPQGAGSGPGVFVVTVQFDAPAGIRSPDAASVREWYFSNAKSRALRVRLYSVYFGTVKDVPQYLGLHEFSDESEARSFAGPRNLSSSVTTFRLLSAFGDVEHNF